MNEEEKKIKEMEEFGIRLISNPSETVAKASPTKLKLQAMTFMVIGKVEKYFSEHMLKQAKEARTLADIGLKNITTMSTEEKNSFTARIDSDISDLENRIDMFNENYERVVSAGRRVLKLPMLNFKKMSNSFRKSANKTVVSQSQEPITNIVDAYKQMNDVFSTSKNTFSRMAKPIKREVEISKAEQDDIKKSVYQALSTATDKKVDDFAKQIDDGGEAKLDDLASKIATNRDKEKELDNFFENISSSRNKNGLEREDLNQILNGGQVKSATVSPEPVSTSDTKQNLNDENPIFKDNTSELEETAGPVSLDMPDWLRRSSTNAESKFVSTENVGDDIFGTSKPFALSNDNFDTLPDEELEGFANRLTGKQTQTYHTETTGEEDSTAIDIDLTSDEIVPNIEDLRKQLTESGREAWEKHREKSEAEQEYKAEKQARENKENELAKSKEELNQMKADIERKKRQQEDIDKLNQKIKIALKIQKQIADNRRQIAEEEEATRKYKSSLLQEKASQDVISKEQEAVQSEQRELQKNTEEIDSDLRDKLEKLENAKRELQGFSIAKGDVSFGNTDSNFIDIHDDGFSAGFYPPIQGRDEQTPKKDDVLGAITPKAVGDEKTSRRR